MKSFQLSAIFGYVTFSVKGKRIVQFFQQCAQANILLWDIFLVNESEVKAKVHTIDYKKITAIADQLQSSIKIEKRNGLSFYMLSLWNEKQKIVAFICSVLLLYGLSHTVWHVEIHGVPVHLEEKITDQLKRMSVYPGSFSTSRLPVEAMESNIMETLPQLLYISVKKRGTIYTVEAVEKKQETPEPKPKPQHLIAAKNGIIHKMLIKDGQAVVAVNDFVKKGDLLVSGQITTDEIVDKVDEEDADNPPLLVASEGVVYANTWYELQVSSKLFTTHEQLQGAAIKHYDVNIGKITIPLKFWPKINFPETIITENKEQIRLFKRDFPMSLIKRTTFDKQTIEITRTAEEAKQRGIDHALKDLQTKLGKDAEILKYYILHEKVESGKVKLRIYVSVLENIAQAVPIAKEDK